MSLRLALSALAALGSIAAHAQPQDRVFDLLDVSWRLSYNETEGSIKGRVVNTVRPLRRGTQSVWFYCGPLSIEGIKVNDKPAKWTLQGERLTVTLPQTADPADTLRVLIAYSGKPTAGLYFVPASRAFPATTSVVYTQGEMIDTRYWIPTYDHPDDKATTEAFIEVPKGHKALSNGRLVSVKPLPNGREEYHWRQELPVVTYLISLVAGRYTEATESWDGLPVSYWVPVGQELGGAAAFAGTNDMIRFFSELTGVRYPWAKFAQSAVPDFMFGGMENVSAVTQTIDTLHAYSAKPLEDSTGLVLHELAHQWFGDLVTCHDWSHIWINEGWASFLPSFYIRHTRGQAAFDMDRADLLAGAHGAAQINRPMVSTDFEEPIDMFDGNAYGGGAARMMMLMNELGEPKFWASTKKYLEEYRYTSLTTEQFFTSFSKSSGRDLDAFRKQWFYTAGAPTLRIRQAGPEYRITRTGGPFRLALPVWSWTGGDWIKTTVDINANETVIPRTGRLILLDPEAWLMTDVLYDLQYSPAEWAELYRRAPNAGQRVRLIGKMGPEAAAILAVEEQDPALLTRLLGVAPPNGEHLMRLTHSSDARVRHTAVERLGALPAANDRLQRLADLAVHDSNPRIRFTAFRIQHRLKPDPARLDAAFRGPWRNAEERAERMGWALERWADQDANRARNECLAQLARPTLEPVRRTAIRLLGRLKDAPGEQRALEALKRVAAENSYGAKTDAIRALGEYGDASAAEVVEAATRHSLHYVRNAAKDTLAKLKPKL